MRQLSGRGLSVTPSTAHAAIRLAAVRAAAIQATYDFLTDGDGDITLKIYSVSSVLLCTMILPSVALDLENYRINLPEVSGTCVASGSAGYAVLIGKGGGDGDLLSVGESGAEINLDTDDLYTGLLVKLSSNPLLRRLQG